MTPLFSVDLSSFVPSLNLSNFQKDHQRENLRNCNISSDALYVGDVIPDAARVLGNWIFLICHPLHQMTVSPLDSLIVKLLLTLRLSHSYSLSGDSLVTIEQWRRWDMRHGHQHREGTSAHPLRQVTQLPGNTGLGPEIKEKPSLEMNSLAVQSIFLYWNRQGVIWCQFIDLDCRNMVKIH